MNSSNSSKGLGNTIPVPPKQISPAKRWCFVLNHWKEEEFNAISSIVPEYCNFCIIGSEIGELGTPHLQGYLEFKTKKRPKSVFDNIRIHWEKAKGNKQQNIEYCSKEEVKYEYPEKYKVEIEEFYNWQTICLDILKYKPDERSIYWFYEHEGCKGKTTLQKYIYTHYQKCIVLSGKGGDMKNGIIEYEKKIIAYLRLS